MNILQVHLELADKYPQSIDSFEGKDVEFKVNVKNSCDPLIFVAKRQNYYFTKSRYEATKLELYEIVHMYSDENLEYGARKIKRIKVKLHIRRMKFMMTLET